MKRKWLEKKGAVPLFALVCALMLSACGSRPMNQMAFADINTGTPIQQVENQYGSPVAIHSKAEDVLVYEYIERIYMGTYLISTHRYYFVVSEGKVVGKYVRYNNPPAYDGIYYDTPAPY